MTRLSLAILLLSSSFALPAETFTYRGTLEDGGTPAEGAYDLQLRLYADAHGKHALSAPIELRDVVIVDGRFAVAVEVPGLPPHLDSGWLEVAVKSVDDGGYWPLPERSQVLLKGAICPASWALDGNLGTDPALNFIGTVDQQPLVLRARNTQVARYEPSGNTIGSSEFVGNRSITANVIAGSSNNTVSAGVDGATIAGGGTLLLGDDTGIGLANIVSASWGAIGGGLGNRSGRTATVGGGQFNAAIGQSGSVGGGNRNSASGAFSTVGGGSGNFASGFLGTVAGGVAGTASGLRSAVIGGRRNCAGGSDSIALGHRAKVRPGSESGEPGTACEAVDLAPSSSGDHGSFVWADSQDIDFVSTGPDQFLVRAAGGMAINTNTPRATLTLGGADVQPFGAEMHFAVGANGATNAGRIRFLEGTDPDSYRGAFIHYNAQTGLGRLNIGVHSSSDNDPANDTAAIVIRRSSGRVGIGRIPTGNDLEVSGSASKAEAGGWLANSDARIKTDIEPLEGAMARLMAVRPVSFRYTEEYRAQHPAVSGQRYLNVLAQEFTEVFPEAVKGSGEYLASHTHCEPDGEAAGCAEAEILQVDTYPALITTIAAVQELGATLELDRSALAARAAAIEGESAAQAARNAELANEVAALRAEIAALHGLLADELPSREQSSVAGALSNDTHGQAGGAPLPLAGEGAMAVPEAWSEPKLVGRGR